MMSGKRLVARTIVMKSPGSLRDAVKMNVKMPLVSAQNVKRTAVKIYLKSVPNEKTKIGIILPALTLNVEIVTRGRIKTNVERISEIVLTAMIERINGETR